MLLDSDNSGQQSMSQSWATAKITPLGNKQTKSSKVGICTFACCFRLNSKSTRVPSDPKKLVAYAPEDLEYISEQLEKVFQVLPTSPETSASNEFTSAYVVGKASSIVAWSCEEYSPTFLNESKNRNRQLLPPPKQMEF